MSTNTKRHTEFWQQRWSDGQTGFHLNDTHPDLHAFLPQLNLNIGDTVFVPLCGKTLDIGYLLAKGYRVVAVEMVEYAVKQLFNQLSMTPDIYQWKQGVCYRASGLTVYVGDYFDLRAKECSEACAVYDRAAMLAIPHKLQAQYCRHLSEITDHAKQLVITVEFDQDKVDGPPFTLSEKDIRRYYGESYHISRLNEVETIKEEARFEAMGLSSFMRRTYFLDPKCSSRA